MGSICIRITWSCFFQTAVPRAHPRPSKSDSPGTYIPRKLPRWSLCWSLTATGFMNWHRKWPEGAHHVLAWPICWCHCDESGFFFLNEITKDSCFWNCWQVQKKHSLLPQWIEVGWKEGWGSEKRGKEGMESRNEWRITEKSHRTRILFTTSSCPRQSRLSFQAMVFNYPKKFTVRAHLPTSS